MQISTRTVHAAFLDSAARRPEATALAWHGGTLSYRELDAASVRMAARLGRAGVVAGQTVAVALPRTAEAIVALLASLRRGAAYLPLDLAYPDERLRFMRADAGALAVVTTAAASSRFPDSVVVAVDIAEPDGAAGLAPAAIDGAVANADALAYVMYTSGSTGQPKGIEICHRGILRLVTGATFMRLAPDVRMLHAAPLGFDAATLEIWGPLLNGGTCVLHDEAVPSGAGLARTIAAHGVTAAWLTSSLFNAVVDDDPRHLAGLAQLLIGGEALSVAHVRRALAALPGVELVNGYGPTECTTFAATHHIPPDLPADARSVPIGDAIQATTLRILDAASMQAVADGEIGELFVGGPGLARGYLRRPDLTAERFVADPFGAPDERLYRTGDRVRRAPGGPIEFIGRADQQVKIRGFRIEPGEIEAALASHPGVRASAVVAHGAGHGDVRLVAYLVAAAEPVATASLRAHLAARLPEFMVPASIVWLDALPLTAAGKVDRQALPAPTRARPADGRPYEAPADALERQVCDVLADVLGIDRLGRHDHFFELGGHSLAVMKALNRLAPIAAGRLSSTAFFERPTPAGIASALRAGAESPPSASAANAAPRRAPSATEPIAIVGMAARFPGARDVAAFWRNLCDGRDSVTTFSLAELDPSLPPALVADPAYVKARGVLDDVELFDASFFGMSPLEADLLDPQQRVFLELCWECMEHGGHPPDRIDAAAGVSVGVFAGMYNASYYQRHLLLRPDLIARLGEFQVMLGNEKDYVATRVAHRLGLTGPAISIHTACSTSLVAIAQAVASLRDGQCDFALAGGASIVCPPKSGYLYEEGAMLSPDGRTRPFDADARGTVFSDGAGVVLLRRLSDALADGDAIHAVIRAAAVNNDGRDKASFTAPSVAGQAAVIGAAHAAAGIDARDVSYVEAHGTATPLGDPVEVEALARAFRRHTADVGFCALGSVKSNIGHTVVAAGAAGVIKTALALAHEHLPATLHFRAPNREIDFAATPFRVVDAPRAWPRGERPRLAGVSSFGVGGTNAHVVLEEPPARAERAARRGPQLLLLSARSPAALRAARLRLADHLASHPGDDLGDVAHTLRVGRSEFAHRATVVAATARDAIERLRDVDAAGSTSPLGERPPQTVLVFPGQGAQYAGMGRTLHAEHAVFRDALEDCLAAMAGHAPDDLRQRLFDGDNDDALAETVVTQPALFALEYALARIWLDAGLAPAALVGHSVGEFVAAVVAGVMTLADAARLVALRGRLMQSMPAGAMLSVRLPAAQLAARLPAGLSIAAENAPSATVVAGPHAAIAALKTELEAQGEATRLLATSHAFHSSMMDAAVAPFAVAMRGVALRPPSIPIVSTRTGRVLADAESIDPEYWAGHLRDTVRFSAAMGTVAAMLDAPLALECGPRAILCALIRQQPSAAGGAFAAIASLGDEAGSELSSLQLAAGRLWTHGVTVAPRNARRGGSGRRIPLPTYPFERQRHWVEALPATGRTASPAAPADTPDSTASIAPVAPRASTGAAAKTGAPAAPEDRRRALVAELRVLLENASGIDLAAAPAGASFLECGLDSLSLTQAALLVRKAFKVDVTFRQLMQSLSSLDRLAQHLDERSTAGEDAAAAGAVASVVAVASAAVGAAAPAPASVVGARTSASIPYDVKTAFGAIARIHADTGTPVTARQRARLDALIRRYVARTARSKAYTAEHRPHLADPRVVNGFKPLLKEITYQIVIERSKGSRLWDLDGNEYIDALNGFGMSLFGWQPAFVLDAVRAQLDSGYDIGPQHPLAGEVARLVCELTGFDRAGLCNTGSEAVMGCVRIARTVTGRTRIAVFSGAYHGIFDEAIVRGTKTMRSMPAAPGIMASAAENVVVLDYGSPESLRWIEANADDIAAVLVEPVQSRRPDLQPRDFLHQLRAVTGRTGTLLVFDEVVTGFRCHPGGAQALFGVRADLASYGKVVGGGFPIGVIAGRRDCMDALDGGGWSFGDDSVPTVGVTYFAGTFVRHPLALAAAKAVLEHLKAEGPSLQAALNEATAAMVGRLNGWCLEIGAPLTLKCFASVWKIFFTEDHPLQDLLFAMMRTRGVHILDNFPCFFTTAHSAGDIAAIEAAFRDSVSELIESEFMQRRAPAPALAALSSPPRSDARLGRDRDGQPAWFVPDPDAPGKFVRVGA